MKKSLAKKVTLSILAGAVLMSSSVVSANILTSADGWENTGLHFLRDSINNTNGLVPVPDNNDDFYSANFSGAYSTTGSVSDGRIKITGGKFQKYSDISAHNFYGGWVDYSGVDKGVSVTDSIVDISEISGYSTVITSENNGYGIMIIGGFVLDENHEGLAKGNKVIISGGKLDDINANGVIVYGGSAQGISKENEVEITNVKEGSYFKTIYGGGAINGAEDNKVVLSAENATYKLVFGGNANSGDISGNTVTISGGTFTDNAMIFGGVSHTGDEGAKKFINNTVTISGTADLTKANLYGGGEYFKNDGSCLAKYGGASTPNTLNIGVDDELKSQLATKGITVDVGAWNNKKVKSIAGFDVINFAYVNWEKNGTVVEATDSLSLASKDSNDDGGTAVTVGTVNVKTGGITANDKMHLLKLTKNGATITGDLNKNGSSKEVTVNINEGVAKTYTGVDCDIEKTNTTIDLIIKETLSVVQNENQGGTTPGNPNPNPNPGGGTGDNTGDNPGGESGGTTPQPERNNQVLVIGESRAAAVAFTNQGSELIETGLNALARDNEKDTKVFAAVYGNHSEYETGSHVNVNGWSGIVGIGKTNDAGLTVGAFFENGEGNYSTHNIFTNDYIRGDGEACYNGGGFLVRKDNANGVYAEASLRAGNLQNELRNAVRNGADLTGYDVDTFYYGAHIGIGKVIPRGNDGDSLDVYGKFIYTHHDGETFDIGGTPTKFDSVESERLRLGFRINEVQTNKLSMYYGAAWEYEFNGDAHDKIASFDLETPSLEGSTVIGEIGAHYKASDKWSIDLNGRAYVGQREGFSGSVQANYSF